MSLFKKTLKYSKKKLSLDEILSLFKDKGKPIYGENYSQAIDLSIGEFGSKGFIASIPTITYLRNELPFKTTLETSKINDVWKYDFDGASMNYKGIDLEGFFGKINEKYMVSTHNLKMPTLKSLLNYEMFLGDLDKGINYQQEVFDNLIHGKTAQGKKIELFHIEDFVNIKERQNKRFGVIVPRSMIPKKEHFYGVKNYIKQPLVIAMKGVPLNDLAVYGEKLDEKLSMSVKNASQRMFICQHNNLEDSSKPVQAQIIYTSSLGVSTGQNFGGNPHRFLVVKR